MPAFAPAHSDELRAACVHAALDAPVKLSGRAIVARAAAGELTDHTGAALPAADVPLSTVQWWAREERKRRATLAAVPEPVTTTQQRAQDLASRLVTLAGLKVTRLEKRGANVDPEQLRATARAVEQCARAVAATQQRTASRTDNGRTPPPEPDAPEQPASFLDTLAQQGTPADAPVTPDDAGTAHAHDLAAPAQPDAARRVHSHAHRSGARSGSARPRVEIGRGAGTT